MSMFVMMKRRERTNSIGSLPGLDKSKVSLGKVCRDHMERAQAKNGNKEMDPRHPSEHMKLDLIGLKAFAGEESSKRERSEKPTHQEEPELSFTDKFRSRNIEGTLDITFQPLFKKDAESKD